MPDNNLQYPIGKFSPKDSYLPTDIEAYIHSIKGLPEKVEAVLQELIAKDKLDTPYRTGGWTARQVLHHIPDSHMNAYIRVKWALTENNPVIKAYNEKAWAETYETKEDPFISVALLKALHAKWVVLLKQLTAQDLKKSFTHPESGKTIYLDTLIAMYAWHGEHHLGHLRLILL